MFRGVTRGRGEWETSLETTLRKTFELILRSGIKRYLNLLRLNATGRYYMQQNRTERLLKRFSLPSNENKSFHGSRVNITQRALGEEDKTSPNGTPKNTMDTNGQDTTTPMSQDKEDKEDKKKELPFHPYTLAGYGRYYCSCDKNTPKQFQCPNCKERSRS